MLRIIINRMSLLLNCNSILKLNNLIASGKVSAAVQSQCDPIRIEFQETDFQVMDA